MPIMIMIAIIAWWIAVLGQYWVSDQWKRSWLFLWSIVIVGLMIPIGKRYYREWHPVGRLQSSVSVRVGPDTSYGCIGTIEQNTLVAVADCKNGWYKIKSSDRSLGWVPVDAVLISSQTSK